MTLEVCPSLERDVVYSQDLVDMSVIYQDNVHLFVWQRLLSEPLNAAIHAVIQSRKSLNITEVVTPENTLSVLHPILSRYPEADALIKDVAELVDVFCCLFDVAQAGLRLVTLQSAMCPRFHVDNVPCRLITTYSGPATQWLPNASVQRHQLGHASGGVEDALSGLIRDNTTIQQLSPGNIALLKGERWPNNIGGGVVHRSPAIELGTTRLFLSLDLM